MGSAPLGSAALQHARDGVLRRRDSGSPDPVRYLGYAHTRVAPANPTSQCICPCCARRASFRTSLTSVTNFRYASFRIPLLPLHVLPYFRYFRYASFSTSVTSVTRLSVLPILPLRVFPYFRYFRYAPFCTSVTLRRFCRLFRLLVTVCSRGGARELLGVPGAAAGGLGQRWGGPFGGGPGPAGGPCSQPAHLTRHVCQNKTRDTAPCAVCVLEA